LGASEELATLLGLAVLDLQALLERTERTAEAGAAAPAGEAAALARRRAEAAAQAESADEVPTA